jgi:hypothetical protein
MFGAKVNVGSLPIQTARQFLHAAINVAGIPLIFYFPFFCVLFPRGFTIN